MAVFHTANGPVVAPVYRLDWHVVGDWYVTTFSTMGLICIPPNYNIY